MLWLGVAVISYFLFAAVSILDNFLVDTAKLKPRAFAFFVGVLGTLLVLLVPVLGFFPHNADSLLFAVLSGMSFILALSFLYEALRLFEPSRVIPAIGGFTPLFSLVFTVLFLGTFSVFSLPRLLSLLLLAGGSVLISWEKKKGAIFQSMWLLVLVALFFAFSFVSIGYVFERESFWIGLLWGRLGGGIMAALFFLFSREVREAVSQLARGAARPVWKRRTTALVFLLNQGTGVAAGLLQQFAIFLAPLSLIAFVAALQGVQYVLLFLLAIFLSYAFPRVLKEKVSPKILFQKAGAIALIALGLLVLALS